jgi:hypothetical protein
VAQLTDDTGAQLRRRPSQHPAERPCLVLEARVPGSMEPQTRAGNDCRGSMSIPGDVLDLVPTPDDKALAGAPTEDT